MGRKIFVSYKYKDNNVYPIHLFRPNTVRTYVDALEEHFEETDNIYKGESDDEDLSHLSDNEIWEKLKDRIFDSSITILIISPTMKEEHRYDKSQWIPWEISYSLKEMVRNDRTSHSNALLAVVLPDRNNSYEYFIKDNRCGDCACRTIMHDKFFKIISNNMFNQINKSEFNCLSGKRGIYTGNSSYIHAIKWSDFIQKPMHYIEIAEGIKDKIDDYKLCKEV